MRAVQASYPLSAGMTRVGASQSVAKKQYGSGRVRSIKGRKYPGLDPGSKARGDGSSESGAEPDRGEAPELSKSSLLGSPLRALRETFCIRKIGQTESNLSACSRKGPRSSGAHLIHNTPSSNSTASNGAARITLSSR